MENKKNPLKLDIGWCEWVSFPALKIPAIEARVVTDTPHSVLSIFNYSTFKEGENLMISFGTHPVQESQDIEVYSVLPVKTRRMVNFVDGSKDWCYVIETEMRIGSMKKNIDLTLVDREENRFRLQLAAKTIKNLVRVNPQKQYLTGQILSDTP
ncbi:MAG: hypothetical protein C0622_03470 [Desulfuromonas sp.]|nr:MAG: hypothetical protein C0622_03470 [Desulfuromonas sp.]